MLKEEELDVFQLGKEILAEACFQLARDGGLIAHAFMIKENDITILKMPWVDDEQKVFMTGQVLELTRDMRARALIVVSHSFFVNSTSRPIFPIQNDPEVQEGVSLEVFTPQKKVEICQSYKVIDGDLTFEDPYHPNMSFSTDVEFDPWPNRKGTMYA